MLNTDQIVSIFHRENISVYETHSCFDADIDVALRSENIQELVCLVKENDIKSVFYSYEYADIDDYLIGEDDIDAIGAYSNNREMLYEEFKRQFQSKMMHFNQEIQSHDFSKPTSLCIYCIMNGIQVGIVQKDPWCDSLLDKDEFLSNLQDMFESSVADKRAEEEALREEVFNLIMDYLDTTNEWHSCTNQRLRRIYCSKLVNEYTEKYNIQLSPYKVIDALEMKWNEYKAKKQGKI